jgi:hypothetical protein
MGFPMTVPLTQEEVLKQYSSKVVPLGTRGVTADGRVFRFTKNGAVALVPGKIVQQAASAAVVGQKSGTTEIRANSEYIKFVPSTKGLCATASGFADGYLYTYTSSTAVGTGQMVQIKSHTKSTSTGTAVIITPYPGNTFYSATTNFGTTAIDIGIIRNPYDKVVVVPTALRTGAILGVPVRPITASKYFWLQTWGACPVRSQGVTDVGFTVGHTSGSSVGQIDASTSTKTATATIYMKTLRGLMDVVGVSLVAGVAGEYQLIFLKIAS